MSDIATLSEFKKNVCSFWNIISFTVEYKMPRILNINDVVTVTAYIDLLLTFKKKYVNWIFHFEKIKI